jgi:transposase
MQRGKFSREYKLEAVKLVRDWRGGRAGRARPGPIRDRAGRWVRKEEADRPSTFPGNIQLKPEQQEIGWLRRKSARDERRA